MKSFDIKGGMLAHLGRRLFHISTIILVPIIYYQLLKPVFPEALFAEYVVITLCFVVLAFEAIRLCNGWVFFGQRSYEAKRFSALAWTTLSLSFLLIFSPSANLTYAIAISCALADPWLGEMRRQSVSFRFSFTVAVGIVFLTWFLLGFSWLVSILMGVLTTVVEKPKLPWVDDNAVMLLVPFLFFGVLHVLCLA